MKSMNEKTNLLTYNKFINKNKLQIFKSNYKIMIKEINQ